jgi:hypothetical protein
VSPIGIVIFSPSAVLVSGKKRQSASIDTALCVIVCATPLSARYALTRALPSKCGSLILPFVVLSAERVDEKTMCLTPAFLARSIAVLPCSYSRSASLTSASRVTVLAFSSACSALVASQNGPAHVIRNT